MDTRVAAYAVIVRDGKLLLTHWRRGKYHGWTLPGGGIEPGEHPVAAVVREVKEETGLDASVGKLLDVDSRVMNRADAADGEESKLHTIRIIYRATVNDGELVYEVNGSSDEARWVPLNEIKNYKTLYLVKFAMRFVTVERKASPFPQKRRRQRKRSNT